MTIWIDAQISPDVARWLTNRFNVEALHVKDLQMVEATDPTIFDAARIADAVVLTKDRDFVELVRRRGVPPRVIWITCGNTSTRELMAHPGCNFSKGMGPVSLWRTGSRD